MLPRRKILEGQPALTPRTRSASMVLSSMARRLKASAAYVHQIANVDFRLTPSQTRIRLFRPPSDFPNILPAGLEGGPEDRAPGKTLPMPCDSKASQSFRATWP